MSTHAATVNRKRIAILRDSIQSIEASFKPHCYGVFCGRHADCKRYNAIEKNSDVNAMAYCSTSTTKPGFIKDGKD